MRFFTAIIIMFSYLELYSQQIKVINDFGINLGVIVEKKLSKKHILQIEQQLRLYNNALKIDDYVFDFGYNYIINKKFKIGGNLRYTYNKKRWKNFENDYRYNLDFYYKLKVTKKSKFQYRLRYQHKYTNLFYEYKTKKINKSTFRNRLKYSYRLNKKNKIYTAIEIYRKSEVFKSAHFNMLHFKIGNIIKTKIGKFDANLGFEQEIMTTNPASFLYLKVIYKFKL